MPKKEKKDRPIFKGRSHKSFLNQCRLKLVTLVNHLLFYQNNYLKETNWISFSLFVALQFLEKHLFAL